MKIARVGRDAVGWLPSLPVMEPRGLSKRNAILDDAARAAGRDPGEITRPLNIFPGQQTPQALAHLAIEDGVSIFILASDDPDVIELFAAETIPAVREHVKSSRLSTERGNEPQRPQESQNLKRQLLR